MMNKIVRIKPQFKTKVKVKIGGQRHGDLSSLTENY